jgi:hypothetical protein
MRADGYGTAKLKSLTATRANTFVIDMTALPKSRQRQLTPSSALKHMIAP